MQQPVRALIIDPFGIVRVETIDAELETLKGIVGGWIEGISPADDITPWHAYCDEEGKIKGYPVNPVATAVAYAFGWPRGDMLCGTVVFLGNGSDGDEADVPQALVDMATGGEQQ